MRSRMRCGAQSTASPISGLPRSARVKSAILTAPPQPSISTACACCRRIRIRRSMFGVRRSAFDVRRSLLPKVGDRETRSPTHRRCALPNRGTELIRRPQTRRYTNTCPLCLPRFSATTVESCDSPPRWSRRARRLFLPPIATGDSPRFNWSVIGLFGSQCGSNASPARTLSAPTEQSQTRALGR